MKYLTYSAILVAVVAMLQSSVINNRQAAADAYIKALEENLDSLSDNYVLDVMSGTDEYNEYYK